MRKQLLNKAGRACLTGFLFCFMLLIFGPAEIYFANVSEFQFIYQEFGMYMALMAVGITLLATITGMLLPDRVYRVYISIIFGMSIAGYIQIMFLNKHLDLLGVNPEGYKVKTIPSVVNLVIWGLILILICVLAFWKYDIWKKLTLYLSVCLLLIQGVAYVSLLVNAKEEAYQYPTGEWHISGEDQFVVSQNKNVIVIILDYFSNTYADSLNASYPGATDFLHDFTYYNNADCTYFGTFPSLAHMLTGCEVDMTKTINDWCSDSWNSTETLAFYQGLRENDFVANVYTPDDNMLCGSLDARLLDGKLSNMSDEAQHRNVDRKLLWKTLFKMSGYRMMPEFVKPLFYANLDEYTNVVEMVENKICHDNYEFYEALLEQGLSVDKKKNYFIVQHLMGPHLWTTDEYGYYKEDATLEETTKGCMVIVEEYLEQLKKLGVYDDATIIITADHGEGYNSQVIFYMKEPGETHESSPINTAPVSHNEFFSTIAKAAGIENNQFGPTVQDIPVMVTDEPRERTYWLRAYDAGYPTVPCYTGDKDGTANVYYGYTYSGDLDDLLEQIEAGPNVVAPVVDSYF